MGKGLKARLAMFAAAAALPCAGARAEGCKIAVLAELPVTMEGLRASIPVRINDHPTSFWLDSGAFFSIMPRAKADELGLKVGPMPVGAIQSIVGIGGSAAIGLTTVHSFGFAKADLHDMPFLVGGTDTGNALIGINVLALRDTEFDLAHGAVKLIEPRDCKNANMAYWAQGKLVFTVPMVDEPEQRVRRFRIPVTINGTKVVAEFDTGAPHSLLSRAAAERAKLDLKDQGPASMRKMNGFGRTTLGGWSVPVDDVGIGDEHVLRTHLDVIDGPIVKSMDAPDMLLGADFALAHHIYFARGPRQVFFTYSGGAVFISSEPRPHGTAPTPAAQASVSIPQGMHVVSAVAGNAAAPATADEFARRGSSELTQRSFSAAIADFTEAIRLAPANAGFYHDRARAYAMGGQRMLARADIDKALALDPSQGELFLTRAIFRLAEKDRPGALEDVEAAAKVTSPSSLDTAEVASLFARLGKPDRALSAIGPVIAAHPDDAKLGMLLNNRCWFRGLANVELAAALNDCNRSIKHFDPNPAVFDSRALVHYRLKDWAAAIADYDVVVKARARAPWALFLRGAARIANGDAAGGKADEDAAKAIDPALGEQMALYNLP